MTTRPSPLQEQYADSTNFRKRTALIARFSTNRYPWYRWVFDQLEVNPDSIILELGCGPGSFWKRNLERTPAGARIIMSDFSAGMLRDARRNLGEQQVRVRLCQLDAAQLPFRDGAFDLVLANMMFYHVRNRPQALRDIRRIMAPGGTFCATTTGHGYMRELQQTAFRLLGVRGRTTAAERFGLENGYTELAAVFSQVELRHYENTLRVTEVPPLMDYFQSMAPLIAAMPERWSALNEHLQQTIAERGELVLPLEVGMLLARR